MRTTLTLNDTVLKKAMQASGITEKSRVVNHALDAYVKHEAGKRLARIGGSMPKLKTAPRCRRLKPPPSA